MLTVRGSKVLDIAFFLRANQLGIHIFSNALTSELRTLNL